ncbi:hypothetical protein F0231_02785 [Vibrio sp. RE86]|uniref:hypothetical protein n=1 Tax=Vibrio sp. RE86 TaxID=2607605 RepID=UPI0014938939|nr:hypothetical protein [Vibrio sp. RE86]NOH78660.1 hypothetical protein [Vibrio sp. RE86]
MRKLALWLALLFSACPSLANVSAPITFHKEVPEQCGLTVLENLGALAFGNDYENRTTTLKLVSNRKGARVHFKLNQIHLGDLEQIIDPSQVHFKLEAPNIYEGDINYWKQGVELHPKLFNPDGIVHVSARVETSEDRVPAGLLNIYIEWGIECI